MGAKRRWIPLSTEFPHDNTGTRLQEEFGPAGIGIWVALLTAAKRAHVQGQFSYVSEGDAWEKLGVIDPPCTFEEFIEMTGRMKKTRKRARGRITDVQITGWEQWNNAPRTGSGRQQTPSVPPDSVRRNSAIESDSDIDIEIDSSNPFFKFLKGKT